MHFIHNKSSSTRYNTSTHTHTQNVEDASVTSEANYNKREKLHRLCQYSFDKRSRTILGARVRGASSGQDRTLMLLDNKKYNSSHQ